MCARMTISGAYAAEPPEAGLLADEVDAGAEVGADALAALPELVEGVEAVLGEEAAVSEEPFEAPSPELLPPPEVPPAALSAAVTAGEASLVLALPLSPPPF